MGKWLQKLCVIHDGVRHLIVEIFLYHSKHRQVLHVNQWNIGVLRYQQTSELIVFEVISSDFLHFNGREYSNNTMP